MLKVVRDRIRQHEVSPLPDKVFKSNNDSSISGKEEDSNSQEDVLGTVLIVDDDPATLFTIDEMVQGCNCNTILAKDGAECLETLNGNIPDLILLDIMMPVMDGFQTINKIRTNARLRDIPVFAVTARAMADDKEIILKHGFNDYIPKPVNSSIITTKIKELFAKIRV
ncbi:MAG: response regulator [Ignavibacteriaceae bacterium]